MDIGKVFVVTPMAESARLQLGQFHFLEGALLDVALSDLEPNNPLWSTLIVNFSLNFFQQFFFAYSIKV